MSHKEYRSKSSFALIVTVLFLFLINLQLVTRTSALSIVPPRSNQDWIDLSILLADTFDKPEPTDPRSSHLSWKLYERLLTERAIYNRYTSLAKKFRRNKSKYALFLAKEYNDGKLEDRAPYNEVVGVVELGMTLGPSPTGGILIPRATIGVLGVSSNFRQNGAGRSLVNKCESVAKEVWNEKDIYVEVEPSNDVALSVFEACGFVHKGEVKDATVMKRRQMENRPHFVLRKTLLEELEATGARSKVGQVLDPEI